MTDRIGFLPSEDTRTEIKRRSYKRQSLRQMKADRRQDDPVAQKMYRIRQQISQRGMVKLLLIPAQVIIVAADSGREGEIIGVYDKHATNEQIEADLREALK